MKIAACIGLLAIATAPVFAQVTDHFKCYYPAGAPAFPPAQVFLLDQFQNNPAIVGPIFRLCNPTKKNHNGEITPIQNPDDHLTLHSTGPQPLVTRQVQIQNQFGNQVLITQDAKYLAVPTQKAPHGPPQVTDHFNCYAVSNGQPINQQVGLKDQFFASQHVVLRPVLFCNPVQKTHNGVVTPIKHPDEHLTCYTTNKVPFGISVYLRNQFGEGNFSTARADSLCVPTKKLAWQVID